MAKKADSRSEAVRQIVRSKKYKEIEKDLRQQLEDNGTYGKFFDDMVDDYMAMYVTKTLLTEDIQKRGTIVKYNNGGGQEGYKKNEAVDMFNTDGTDDFACAAAGDHLPAKAVPFVVTILPPEK